MDLCNNNSGLYGNSPLGIKATKDILDVSSLATKDSISSMYGQFKDELFSLLAARQEYCSKDLISNHSTPHVSLCLTGQAEIELLYMRIRVLQPHHVLELASAWGGTTLAILAALHRNGRGVLHSVDLLVDRTWYETELFSVLKTHFDISAERSSAVSWAYYFGDAQKFHSELLAPPYEYIHIDADHSGSFAHWYTHELLARVAAERPFWLSVHDVADCECVPDVSQAGRTPEGKVVESWLLYGREHRVLFAAMFSMCHDRDLYSALQSARKLVLPPAFYHQEVPGGHSSIWATCGTTDYGDYISTSYSQVAPAYARDASLSMN